VIVAVVTGGLAAAAVPALAATTSGSRAVAACASTDLSVSVGPVDAGAGQRYTTLDFSTLAGKTCVLKNNLTGFQFLGNGSEGGAADLPTHAVREAGSSSEAVTLKPGTIGHLDLHYSVVGTPVTPVSLTFVVPADGGHTATPWNATVGDSGRIGIGHLHL
jgi:hypothetical protein